MGAGWGRGGPGARLTGAFLACKRDAYLADDDGPVSFTAALMSKDLQLALAIADGAGLALPLAGTPIVPQSTGLIIVQ